MLEIKLFKVFYVDEFYLQPEDAERLKVGGAVLICATPFAILTSWKRPNTERKCLDVWAPKDTESQMHAFKMAEEEPYEYAIQAVENYFYD